MANNCPACSKAELILVNGMYKCENCGNSFSLDTIEKYSNNYEETDENIIKINSYQCIRCKKSFTSFSDKVSETCPYCGEHIIIKEDMLRDLHLQKMIKFKVSQDEAIKKFKRYIKRRIFFPSFFNLKEIEEKVVGMYIPFEICDCDVQAKINFWCTEYGAKMFISTSEDIKNFKEEGVRNSEYRTYEIKKYIATRNGKIKFENILRPSPSYNSNKFINCVQPFDCQELLEFDEKLFKKFLIDNTTIDQKNMKKSINQLVQSMTYNEFKKSVRHGKIEVYDSEMKVDFRKFESVLLPIYFLVIKDDNGHKYNFTMNGQTGKISGIVPKSKRKRLIWGIGVFSAIELIISLVKYFLKLNISNLEIFMYAIISTVIMIVAGCLIHKKEGKHKDKYYKKGSLQYFNKNDFLVAEKTFRELEWEGRITSIGESSFSDWMEKYDDIEKKWYK